MSENRDRPNIKGPALPERSADDSAVTRMRQEVTKGVPATQGPPEPREAAGGAVDRPHGVLQNYFETIVEIVPKKVDTKPMNLRIPTDLHRRLKILAGLQGVTRSLSTAWVLRWTGGSRGSTGGACDVPGQD
jgi:hypothetical protein